MDDTVARHTKMKLLWKYSVLLLSCFILTSVYIFTKLTCITRDTKDIEDEIHKECNKGEDSHIVIGPGEGGKAVIIDDSQLSESDQQRDEEGKKKHFVRAIVSDFISVHRTLPSNLVEEECRQRVYTGLPPVSVTIPFRDEIFTVLLRTVHSILNRTPPNLLREILLIDDGSTDNDLKGKLDIYVSNLQKVRVIRLGVTKGLMVARQRGIDESLSDMIVVMDSHMEVADVWLEPLLERVVENPKRLVAPKVETIHGTDFGYYFSQLYRGAVTYSFDFYLSQTMSQFRIDYLESRPNFELSPVSIPSIQGNIFLVNKTYFMQLGGLDTGMHVWGAEQMEMSIKYIMCGAGIEMIPCSHVGHLYRTAVPWRHDESKLSNEYRVAEVWMDDYKHLVFEMNANYTMETGDVTERKLIRQRNNCKPFSYFLEETQRLVHFYIPVNLRAKGAVKSISTGLCLDDGSGRVELWPCHNQGGKQFWEWSKDYEVRHTMVCVTTEDKSNPIIVNCKYDHLTQWDYLDDNTIQMRDNKLCLTALETKNVKLASCDGSDNQKWLWKRLQ